MRSSSTSCCRTTFRRLGSQQTRRYATEGPRGEIFTGLLLGRPGERTSVPSPLGDPMSDIAQFTSDLDKLFFGKVSRVNVGVFIDASGQSFCATAWGGDHERAATHDDAFRSDGEHVKVWSDRG
jgi:hypothetical protein